MRIQCQKRERERDITHRFAPAAALAALGDRALSAGCVMCARERQTDARTRVFRRSFEKELRERFRFRACIPFLREREEGVVCI